MFTGYWTIGLKDINKRKKEDGNDRVISAIKRPNEYLSHPSAGIKFLLLFKNQDFVQAWCAAPLYVHPWDGVYTLHRLDPTNIQRRKRWFPWKKGKRVALCHAHARSANLLWRRGAIFLYFFFQENNCIFLPSISHACGPHTYCAITKVVTFVWFIWNTGLTDAKACFISSWYLCWKSCVAVLKSFWGNVYCSQWRNWFSAHQ